MEDVAMPFDDFDGQQEYQKSITISTVLGGWTVRYTDKNPNYVTWMKDDTYDPKFHLQYFSRTRIFTEASKLVDWLTTRI